MPEYPLGTGEIIEYTISANTKFIFYSPSIEKSVYIARTADPYFFTGVPVNDDTVLIMLTYTQNQQYPDHFLYYATLFITDGQNSLTFDFNNLKAIPEKITEIEAFAINVVCYNAKEIIMTDPKGRTLTEVVDDTEKVPSAEFIVNFADFPDLLFSFTPVK